MRGRVVMVLGMVVLLGSMALPRAQVLASADCPSVLHPGSGNTIAANAMCATIGGGDHNAINSDFAHEATISGGDHNIASGPLASIGGGYNNTASASIATISGGFLNTASGDWTVIGGGARNRATTDFAVVSGGYYNSATALYASIGGGGPSESDNPLTANQVTGRFTARSVGAATTGRAMLAAPMLTRPMPP